MRMPKRIVLLDDPENQPEEPLAEFPLTYDGPLLATQRDAIVRQVSGKSANKHAIRKVFHYQLKRLWEITPFLKNGAGGGPSSLLLEGGQDAPVYDIASLSKKHCQYGFGFVPLVTEDLNLICGLEILFLRPALPGKVIWGGDIDNRLKTLFDAMSIPVAGERYVDRVQEDDEKPFLCLLEDDKLITKVSVETDQLLQLSNTPADSSHVRLIITVRLKPYEMHSGNMQFG